MAAKGVARPTSSKRAHAIATTCCTTTYEIGLKVPVIVSYDTSEQATARRSKSPRPGHPFGNME